MESKYMTIAKNILDKEVKKYAEKNGVINILEWIYSNQNFSKFKKVQWGNHYYDGLEFCDGGIIAIKPDHFNSLEIVAI